MTTQQVKPFPFKPFGGAAANAPASAVQPSGFTAGVSAGQLTESPRQKKRHTEEEIQTLLQEAQKKGQEEGEKIGFEKGQGSRLELDQQLQALLQSTTGKLSEFQTVLEETIATKHQDTLKLATAIARKIAGSALKENAFSHIEDTIKKAITILFQEQELTIHVSATHVDALNEKIQSFCAEKAIALQVSIAGNENMPATDCKITWKNGEINSSPESMWQGIEKILETL